MDRYRHLGIKLTPQRLAVLRYLEGNKEHPSAEDIYRAVHRKFPTMSLATVYNALTKLKEKGGVRELTLDPGRKRFDPDTSRHDHLICISCSRIVDIPHAAQSDLPEDARQDFSVVASHVEYYGICPGCRTKKDKTIKEAVHVRRP